MCEFSHISADFSNPQPPKKKRNPILYLEFAFKKNLKMSHSAHVGNPMHQRSTICGMGKSYS